MDEEMRQYLEGMEARLKEHAGEQAEAIETRILRAFEKFARANEARHRVSSALYHSLDARMDLLEDRVTRIEGGTPEG